MKKKTEPIEIEPISIEDYDDDDMEIEVFYA